MAMNDPGGPGDPGAAGAGGPEPQTFSKEYVQELRREAAGLRIRLKQVGDAAVTENRSLKIDLAFAEMSDLDGLDRKYVRFLLAEEKKLDDLDVNAADFRERLKDRVSDLIGRNPGVRSGATGSRAVPRTSGIPAGGPGQVSDQLSRSDLAGMTKAQIVGAFQAGKTNALLGRRG